MSTYREAQSRTVDEIEKIVEMAVAKLDAKRAPKESNEISFHVNRVKALPQFDPSAVSLSGFVIDGLHKKIKVPHEWASDAVRSIRRLSGPGLFKAGFQFRGDGSQAEEWAIDSCSICVGSRSALKSEQMELSIELNWLSAYDIANLEAFRDRFQFLRDAAEIPIRVSAGDGTLVSKGPSNVRHLLTSNSSQRLIPNELVVELGWSPTAKAIDSLVQIAHAGTGSSEQSEGFWKVIVDAHVDKGSDPTQLYALLLSDSPKSTQIGYGIWALIPDIRTCESVINEAKLKSASMSLADMNLPHPDHPDDPDMIYWLTLGADYRKGAFYLELAIDHSQKKYLPVVNSALGTSFR